MLLKEGDRKALGSKGFDLYRCVLLGANVPDFAVIPTEFHAMEDRTKAMSLLREELARTLTELGGVVAVRSSSVAEDTCGRSNAGRFRTVLGVDSLGSLEEAVTAVWGSSERRPRQIGGSSKAPPIGCRPPLTGEARLGEEDRRSSGPALAGGRSSMEHPMAVIIQRMLRPDIAGVLFTRNPVSGADSTVIEYVEGLGEALVSGKRDPARLELPNERKNHDARLNHRCSRHTESASRWEELLRTASALEEAFGYPLDIEWACCGGVFHILQARPITNLPAPEVASGPSYSRVHAEEFFSGPVTPLFHSVFQRLYSENYVGETLETLGISFQREQPLLVRHKNYLYTDTGMMELALSRMPSGLGDARKKEVLPPDIRNAKNRTGERGGRGSLLRLLGHLMISPRLWITRLDRHFRERVVPDIISRLEDADDLRGMGQKELMENYEELMDIAALHIRTSKWGLVLYSIPLSELVARFMDRNGIEREKLPALMMDLEDNRTLEATRELGSLADIMMKSPEASRVIRKAKPTYAGYRDELEKVPGGALMVEHFESILMRYGHRRLSRDLISPSWSDEPMIPFGIVRQLVLEGKARPGPAGGAERRAAVQLEIERRLPWGKRMLFRKMSKYLARYTSFRELQRFYLDMILSKLRGLMLEISRRMLAQGSVKREDDIFFLEMRDIENFLLGKNVGERDDNLERKALFNRLGYENLTGTPGRYMRQGVDFDAVDTSVEKEMSGSSIRGQSVSPGEYSGRVRVIPDLNAETEMEKGDVLITRCLDPGQTHFLMMAGALILEVGGMLSHGAILARELGIPTVAQVRNATTLFRDGQKVLVDGSRGTVAVEG
jgi:phosphohistidine swiveling domain-containing protein